MTGFAEWIADHRAEESPAEKIARMSHQAEERADRAEAIAEAERRAVAEDEREARLFRYGQLGLSGRSPGETAADAIRAAAEDDEYEQARKTIERVEKRRAVRQEAARYQAEQVAAVVQRSESSDPLEQATRRAHRAFAEHTRALVADVAAGTPRREPRPKGRGGVVVRSELECWHCVSNNVSHEESILLHLDPRFNVPITTVEQAVEVEQAEHAERRTRVRGHGLAIR